MDFRNLEYIVSIAKHQSIGKAAQDCFVSQSTLSKFIHNLEHTLGQPLFQRAGNRFLLTYAGERYVATAKSILESKKNLDQELADTLRENTGELKIAFRINGGINFLPQLLSVYWKSFPRIKLKVYEYNSPLLEDKILQGDIDLAFIRLPIEHSEITHEIIAHDKLLLLMAPDHPKAGEGILREGWKYPWIDIAKLKDEDFILQWPEQRIRQTVDKLFHKAGFKPNILLTISNTSIAAQMACEGFGISFAREIPLQYITPTKKLLYFSVGETEASFNFVIAYRAETYQPVYVKEFINIAKELLGPGGLA